MQIAAACSENHSGPFSDAFFGLGVAEWCDFSVLVAFQRPPVFRSDSTKKKVLYLLFRIARRNTGWALENNLFGKIAPYRELCGIRSSPLSEAFIVLEHVTWWPTPWEPFHHSLELANENCLARAPKNGPVRGDHF